jgi:hypothetical protein
VDRTGDEKMIDSEQLDKKLAEKIRKKIAHEMKTHSIWRTRKHKNTHVRHPEPREEEHE